MKLEKISLKSLFTLTFFILGIVIVGMGGYLFWLDSYVERVSNDTVKAVEGIEIAQHLQKDLFAHKRHYLLFGLRGNPERLHAAQDAEKSLIDDLSKVAAFHLYNSDASSPANLENIQNNLKLYLDKHESLRSSGRGTVEVYRSISEEFDIAYDSTEALINFNIANVNKKQTALKRLGYFASVAGTTLVFLSALAIGLLVLFLRNWLFQPLTKLRQAIIEMKRTRSFSIRAPVLGLHDIQDITNCFNELGAELEHHQKSQFKFIATVAHDIKNPLGAMAMSAEILAEDLKPESPNAHETIGILRRQISALEKVVGDLLQSSAMEADTIKTEIMKFDLNDLIAETISLHKLTSSRRFEFMPLQAEARCESDPARLTQILNNLLSNAIKYSPEGSSIHIEVLDIGGHYNILVKDSGIGIPKENLETIFLPFQRSKGAKENFVGTGLGLSSCKRIIQALGGDIYAESRDGQGSTFTVVIPKNSNSLKPSTEASSPSNFA